MLGCEQQFANNHFTSLELQRKVSAKLAQRRGAALLVLLPRSPRDSALLRFAPIC
jgi:hypothetical protein